MDKYSEITSHLGLGNIDRLFTIIVTISGGEKIKKTKQATKRKRMDETHSEEVREIKR